MAKLTKVFGSIMIFTGGVLSLYTFFVYLNSSAYLNYNVDKQPSIAQAGFAYPFIIGALLLIFGVLFAKDRKIS
jgi:hypothetical protein